MIIALFLNLLKHVKQTSQKFCLKLRRVHCSKFSFNKCYTEASYAINTYLAYKYINVCFQRLFGDGRNEKDRRRVLEYVV